MARRTVNQLLRQLPQWYHPFLVRRRARADEPEGVTPREKVYHPRMDNKPNPYLLGFSIGICFGLALLVSVVWFPWIGDAKYKQLRDFLFFSVGMFIILIGRYWNVRRVPKLWLAFLILAGAHSVGCWLYITRVGSLSPMRLILLRRVKCFLRSFSSTGWRASRSIKMTRRSENLPRYK